MPNDESQSSDSLPLLIVCGWLGSGKTTFLNYLLTSAGSPTLAALDQRGELLQLINDFADVNVDATLTGASTSSSRSHVVSLAGGCVCCNLLEPLLAQLQTAVDRLDVHYRYAILECTGLADAAPVVAALLVHPTLRHRIDIDAVVTVVDGLQYDVENDPLKGSQLEGTNVLLMSKEDLLLPSASSDLYSLRQERLHKMMEKVQSESNPNVIAQSMRHGAVVGRQNYDEWLIGQRLFAQHQSCRWFLSRAKALLQGPVLHPSTVAGETEALGVRSFTFVFRSVHPVRLSSLLAHLLGKTKNMKKKSIFRDLWRSKGYFEALDDDTGETRSIEKITTGDPKVQLFTWSSVGKQFDYGPVLAQPHSSARTRNDDHCKNGSQAPALTLAKFVAGHALPLPQSDGEEDNTTEHETGGVRLQALLVMIGPFEIARMKQRLEEIFQLSVVTE